MWRGHLTPRRCAVLVQNLPPGAALYAALGEDAAWSQESNLLAACLDALHGANWQRSGKGPAPKPVPRPSDHAAQAARADRHVARAERFLKRQRERGE